MKKRKPSEFARIYGSRERVTWVKSLPCLVAGGACEGPIDNAHTATGGTGYKAGYKTIVPLCRYHHERLHAIGHARFHKDYFVDLASHAVRIEREWSSVVSSLPSPV